MEELASVQRQLIGLTGGKGVGKDTCARHLSEVFGMRQFAFADPVKQGLCAMFGVSTALFNDPAVKETPLPDLLGNTPRHLMQTLGTGWGRGMVSDTVWVDLMAQKIEKARVAGFGVVVSDVRYDNEAELIRRLGGFIWSIERQETVYSPQDPHSSEAGISPHLVDRRIFNTHDLHMLYTQLGVALARIAG